MVPDSCEITDINPIIEVAGASYKNPNGAPLGAPGRTGEKDFFMQNVVNMVTQTKKVR
nr:hypothetical protein [uncultured Methanospirillum sp.]